MFPRGLDVTLHIYALQESDYGKYRLWGAVGWGVFSTVAGEYWVPAKWSIRTGVLPHVWAQRLRNYPSAQ